MKKHFLRFALIAAATSFPCHAESFSLEDDEIILGVVASEGTGAAENVFFNLGPAHQLRDNGNAGVVGVIGDTLKEVFGDDWFEREDVYFGVMGNLRNNPPAGVGQTLGARPPVNGDPSRTTYVSRAAASPATAAPWEGHNFNDLALATGDFALLKTAVTALEEREDGSAVMRQSVHQVEWNNSWSVHNPLEHGGAAFRTFSGTIMQNFGKSGPACVDIQRIVSTNVGAEPPGTVFRVQPPFPDLHRGDYIATLEVSADGSLRLFKQTSGGGEETTFSEWIEQFAAQIPNEADRLPGADADGDGVTNFEEFAFGGHPANASSRGVRLLQTVDTGADADSDRELTLTLEVRAGAAFELSGNVLIAGRDGVFYRIEGSVDLTTFDSPVSEVTPHLGGGAPADGYEFRTFRLDASNGLPGKGFLRTKAEPVSAD